MNYTKAPCVLSIYVFGHLIPWIWSKRVFFWTPCFNNQPITEAGPGHSPRHLSRVNGCQSPIANQMAVNGEIDKLDREESLHCLQTHSSTCSTAVLSCLQKVDCLLSQNLPTDRRALPPSHKVSSRQEFCREFSIFYRQICHPRNTYRWFIA